MWENFGRCTGPTAAPMQVQYRLTDLRGQELTRGFFEPRFDTCPMAFVRRDVWPETDAALEAALRGSYQHVLERMPVPARMADLILLLENERAARRAALQDARSDVARRTV